MTDITDEMVAKGAAEIRDLLTMLGVDPDELTEHNDAPTVAAQVAESVLQAGLAGCTVVELPTLDADGDCLIGEELDAGAVGVINVDAGAYEVGLYLDGVGFGLKPDRARRIAAAILAAVARGDERVAPDRLAGSVSPKGDNTDDE